jgi:F-type H+-transporting ATPase subunit beta
MRVEHRLPPIYSLLRAGDGGRIVIEVLAQQDAHHVHGIALTPTQGLARGMQVEDTGGPLKAPVGKSILSRMFDVFGNTIDRGRDPVRGVRDSPQRFMPGRSGCASTLFSMLSHQDE